MPKIQNISINLLDPTKDNTRVYKKDDEFNSLVESIKQHGILGPILVRNSPAQKGRYEIRAGERRYHAACYAKLKTVPCIVLNLNDQEAREVTVIENLHRKDLSPMEAAEAIQKLTEGGNSLQEVADKIGKSQTWVVRIAKLTDLTPEWQKAAEGNNGKFNTWRIGHYILIARFPENIQKQLYKEYSDYINMDVSLNDLEKDLSKLTHYLKLAPWDLKGCEKCTKRSGVNPGLFDERSDKYSLSKDDRCLDTQCWERKQEVAYEKNFKDMQAKYPNLVQVSEEYGCEKGVLEPHKWEKVAKKTPHALPAISTNGKYQGKLIWVTLANDNTMNISNKRPLDKNGNPKPTPLKERREQYKSRRKVFAMKVVQELIKQGKQPRDPSINEMIAMAVAFGVVALPYDHKPKEWNFVDTYRIRKTECQKMLWEQLRPNILKNIRYLIDTRVDNEKEAAILCSLFGIDWKAEVRKGADAIPYPKSWENLNEDGTVKVKKAA